MSHFLVLVATEKNTDEALAFQLAPFHEYECTGLKDEFVRAVDITEESLADARKAYEEQGQYAPKGLDADSLSDWFGYPLVAEGHDAKVTEDGKSHILYAVAEDGSKVVKKMIRFTNPDKKWDWWVVGGRWSPVFELPVASGTYKTNVIQKRHWEAARAVAVAEAAEQKRQDYVAMRAVLAEAGLPIQWDTWESIRDTMPIEDARKEYARQPQIAVLQKNHRFFGDDWDAYLMPEEEAVKLAEASAGIPYAFLHNREWHAKGTMGWWGMSHGERADWIERFNEVLATVPDDWFLHAVDCHI